MNHQIRARSGRVLKPGHKSVTTHQVHLQAQSIKAQNYMIDTTKIIAQTMETINHQFVQTYSLMKSIKEYGEKGQ